MTPSYLEKGLRKNMTETNKYMVRCNLFITIMAAINRDNNIESTCNDNKIVKFLTINTLLMDVIVNIHFQ